MGISKIWVFGEATEAGATGKNSRARRGVTEFLQDCTMPATATDQSDLYFTIECHRQACAVPPIEG